MTGRGHDLVERTGITAELNSSVGGVGTGNIQLVGCDAFAFIQDFDGSLVVLAGIAEHVGDDHDVLQLAQPGELFVDEGAGADVLQSDGIEHAGGGLVKARRGIAGHGLFRKSLHHEAAELVQVDDVFELDAVAKRATGGDYRVLELNAGEAHAKVRSALAGGGRGGHRDLVYRVACTT